MLDLWFERKVRPRLKGKAWLIRYIDDFVVCFQYCSDAQRLMEVLPKRLEKFALKLEPDKNRLIRFGRSAGRKGKRPETIYFLGFTHYWRKEQEREFYGGKGKRKSPV